MPTVITATRAVEESTFVVTASFADENGDAVTPTALTWTLSKTDGTAINNRTDVSITPAASVDIVLSGDDLQIFAGDNYQRVLTLEGTYTSDLGTGLPLNDELYFSVEDLVNVA